MVLRSALDEAWSALLDQQKKTIVPLYKRLENFKRIQHERTTSAVQTSNTFVLESVLDPKSLTNLCMFYIDFF